MSCPLRLLAVQLFGLSEAIVTCHSSVLFNTNNTGAALTPAYATTPLPTCEAAAAAAELSLQSTTYSSKAATDTAIRGPCACQ